MVSLFLLFSSHLKPRFSLTAHLFLLVDRSHKPDGILVLSVDLRQFYLVLHLQT